MLFRNSASLVLWLVALSLGVPSPAFAERKEGNYFEVESKRGNFYSGKILRIVKNAKHQTLYEILTEEGKIAYLRESRLERDTLELLGKHKPEKSHRHHHRKKRHEKVKTVIVETNSSKKTEDADAKSETKTEAKSEEKTKTPEAKPAKPEIKPEAKPEEKPAKHEVKPESEAKPKTPESKTETKLVEPETKPETKPETESEDLLASTTKIISCLDALQPKPLPPGTAMASSNTEKTLPAEVPPAPASNPHPSADSVFPSFRDVLGVIGAMGA